ncbi:MAG: hypothetical protein ACXAD7_08565, partial [Candidatus Kariarchaeaceae archaeon]
MMIQELFLYNWIKFDFYNPFSVSSNFNGYYAVADVNGCIVIWQQTTDISQKIEGSLISIIVNQFQNIKQVRWILDQEKLLIRHDSVCTIWDPFENEEICSIECDRPVFFTREFEEGYANVYSDGSIEVYGKGYTKTTPKSSGLIWNRSDSIVVYPFEYHFEEGKLVHLNADMQRLDKRIRRAFRNENSIENHCKVYVEANDVEISSLQIPEHLNFRFEQAKIVLINAYPDAIYFTTNNFSIVKHNAEDIDHFLSLGSKRAIIKETRSTLTPQFRLTVDMEIKINSKNNNFFQQNLLDLMKNSKLEINKIPVYFYTNMKPTFKHTFGDFVNGLLWVPDYDNDHFFIDLFENNG